MSSRLQLDMRNLSLGRRHLVYAYEVEAGIGVNAGNTVWSMPERLECAVLQKARYINTLTLPTYLLYLRSLAGYNRVSSEAVTRGVVLWYLRYDILPENTESLCNMTAKTIPSIY